MDAAYTPLSRDIVEISGPDRDSFLQGLISQDIDKVTPTRAAYGALLSPQGKYLHDFCLVEMGEAIWLDCEGGRGADLAKRLSIFRLRSKVTVTLRDDLTIRAVFGPDAAAAMDLGGKAGDAAAEESIVRFVDPRTAELGVRMIGPADALAAALDKAGLREVPFAEWDRLRISLTVPDGTRDLDPDRSILLESNFEALNGVDWQKGCYMGQELTARTKYRGLVKRRLVAVALEGAAPDPGTPIGDGNRTVGELRSVCGDRALATLRVDALQHEGNLQITDGNGGNLRVLTDLQPD